MGCTPSSPNDSPSSLRIYWATGNPTSRVPTIRLRLTPTACRDLLSVLDIERVTIVGHSLGGGVAMQFAYQFPQLVDRLILVSAGGVTKDVNIVFRLASLPMGSEAMALLRLPLVLPAVQIAGRIVGKAIGTTSLGTTCPMCCAFWTTCQSRRLLRRSAAPCGQWWTGGGRWSPCWTDAI